MTVEISEIWQDDRLGRRKEAEFLERHIQEQVRRRALRGASDSYVLAINAPYGHGKTWFLKRFRDHLSVNHPVAFIDAWVDDANNEPAVAMMASINEALEPFVSRNSKISQQLKAATLAVLPIIGKAAIGGASKFVQRHVGENIFYDVSEQLQVAKIGIEKSAGASSEVAGEAIVRADQAVSELVDRYSQDLIAAYSKRLKSREQFKKNMNSLINSIENFSSKKPPLIVIVDELDRCRPDYAISFLEQIKHLFDVSNVVFLLSVNLDQLQKSISAVYGSEFESGDYLRRFFTRKYDLRELSLKEIVKEQFRILDLQDSKFFVPVLSMPGISQVTCDDFIGMTLDELYVTAREAFNVMDVLALFHDQWKSEFPIELVVLLPMIVSLIRAEPISIQVTKFRGNLCLQGLQSDHTGRVPPINFAELSSVFSGLWNSSLPTVADQSLGGPHAYVRQRFARELEEVHRNRWSRNSPPLSLIASYEGILRLVERMSDTTSE